MNFIFEVCIFKHSWALILSQHMWWAKRAGWSLSVFSTQLAMPHISEVTSPVATYSYQIFDSPPIWNLLKWYISILCSFTPVFNLSSISKLRCHYFLCRKKDRKRQSLMFVNGTKALINQGAIEYIHCSRYSNNRPCWWIDNTRFSPLASGICV